MGPEAAESRQADNAGARVAPNSVSIPRIFLLAALGLWLVLLAWQLRQLALPYQFDYVEGMMLHGVSVAASGQTLYPPLGRLPYLITAYPPLYYYLCATGNLLLGHSFLFGRLVSLVSMLSLALFIALVVHRRTGWRTASLLAAAAFCLTLPARNWAVLMRVDALEVALAAWGFYAAIFAPARARSIFLAGLLFLASFLTKQTMFAAPAAVLLVWWLAGRRRSAVELGAALAVSAAAIFLFLGWRTGWASFVYLFGIHPDPVLPGKWFREFLFLGRTLPVVLVLAGWFLVRNLPRRDPLAIYLVFAFASTFFGAKLASFWNHYLEFCAVACLAAGCAAAQLRGELEQGQGRAAFLAKVALAVQVVLLVPLMMPWRLGQWFHGAGALALAAGAGWCAYRAWNSRWAGLLAGALVLSFPGVWHWGLAMLSIWPSLLAVGALAMLIEGRPLLAGLAALAAGAAAASFAPVVLPVAWAFLRPGERGVAIGGRVDRRYAGLLLILVALVIAALRNPEANVFHSPASVPLPADMPRVLQNTGLLLVLAFAASRVKQSSAAIPVYALVALPFALLVGDARLWLDLAVALAVLSASLVTAAGRGAMAAAAPAALLLQLALLSPFELWLAPGYDDAQLRYLYQKAARTPDPIISENVALMSAARKPVLVSDPYVVRLAPRLFPEQPILHKLRRQEIAMVALLRDPTAPDFPRGDSDPVWSRAFRDTMLRYYRKAAEYDIGRERFFLFSPSAAPRPREYICYRTPEPIVPDGDLAEAAWKAVPWTEDFVDIEGAARPRPRFRTRARLLWDDRYLYVAAELEEPHVWGTLTRHDSIIFRDNDFELFLDPDGDRRNYYELEVNALNTAFDLLLPRPYREGGQAMIGWDIAGLRKGVKMQGTLNDPRDIDHGWTLEWALPWSALREYAGTAAVPPVEGHRWRLNFSRVEWQHEVRNGGYHKVAGRSEDNWVWSPQGVIDMHLPERWGYLRFSTKECLSQRLK